MAPRQPSLLRLVTDIMSATYTPGRTDRYHHRCFTSGYVITAATSTVRVAHTAANMDFSDKRPFSERDAEQRAEIRRMTDAYAATLQAAGQAAGWVIEERTHRNSRHPVLVVSRRQGRKAGGFVAEVAERTVVITCPSNERGGAALLPDGWEERAQDAHPTLHAIEGPTISGAYALRWRDQQVTEAELLRRSLALVRGAADDR